MEPPYARLEGREFEFLMQKRRIVIGRNSKMGQVDVNMGHSRFISRKHLDILMDRGMFYLICRGKNGIFVNDVFQRREAAKFPLPNSCMLRFPSTQIVLAFTSLIDSAVVTKMAPSFPIGSQDSSLLQVSSRIDHSHSPFVSPFVSPCPSPTGTISAVNSCPPSPGGSHNRRNRLPSFEIISRYASKLLAEQKRNGDDPSEKNQEEEEYEDLEEQEDNGGDSGSPSGSPSRNEGGDKSEDSQQKPPYSYAQLIVQALLANKERKQTLSGIYQFISTTYPHYKITDKGWKNSIRHNLSLNQYFMKAPRQPMSGKGGYWCMHPDFGDKLIGSAYTKRRKKGVPVFPTSGIMSRSAPSSPTNHVFLDFAIPTCANDSPSNSKQQQPRAFQPPPPVSTMGSSSLPGSPIRKSHNSFNFKPIPTVVEPKEWLNDAREPSCSPPQSKKARFGDEQNSPDQPRKPIAVLPQNAASMVGSHQSVGIPYMTMFAPVPIAFPGQMPPQFMPIVEGASDPEPEKEESDSNQSSPEDDNGTV